ncbi:MAG TPA: PilZ domain-containing protein [Vicinamibacterales bacterium]
MTAHLFLPRAPRYEVPIRVLYRTTGESAWLEGSAVNISTSGVLVSADRVMALQTPIELLLTVPPNVRTPFAGTTICRGHIVRAVQPSTLEDRPAFAAAITEFEISHLMDPRRI